MTGAAVAGKQLTDSAIAEIVTRVLTAGGFSSKAQMGPMWERVGGPR